MRKVALIAGFTGFGVALALGFGNRQAALAAHAEPTYALKDVKVETEEVKLLNTLTLCVGTYDHSVDKECLKRDFYPLLGLTDNDRVIAGYFGINMDGNFFSFSIEKESSSRKTIGLFDAVFYTRLEMYRGENTYSIWALSANGQVKTIDGDPVTDKDGLLDLVNIYDVIRQDYVIDDGQGRVGLMVKRHGTVLKAFRIAPLIDAGKKVGAIMTEHLDALERSDKGETKAGATMQKYQKEAKRNIQNRVNVLK